MRITPLGKAILVLLGLTIIYFGVRNFGGDIRNWATGGKEAAPASPATADDFGALRNVPADPGRNTGSEGVAGAVLATAGKINRPLVVAINTWAGHAPGIVANGGLDTGSAASLYKKQFGLDVKFVLLEDPAAKLAAFRNGDVDIMWNTVDNWAREASILAEQNQKAKSIVMQDWSRGGDGIVSLSSITSIEGRSRPRAL